jgi:hypothetical protein
MRVEYPIHDALDLMEAVVRKCREFVRDGDDHNGGDLK